MVVSLNFAFLEEHDPQLVQLGGLAEQYFTSDPNTSLIKLRQFGERLAQLIAANVGLYVATEDRQVDLLRRLKDRGLLNPDVERLFHELRRTGNDATHALTGDARTALSHLKYARQLGIWFHRVSTKNPNFHPGAFVPPPDPTVETEALKQELELLRAELATSVEAAELAQIEAQQEVMRRRGAEDLAREAEAKAQAALDHLAAIQARAESAPAQSIQQTIQTAQQTEIDLDERETRRLIDIQLRNAGWSADSEQLTYNNGTRPQKGRNMAIAEWQTASGRADYVLFAGLQAVAVVEAKRNAITLLVDSLFATNVVFPLLLTMTLPTLQTSPFQYHLVLLPLLRHASAPLGNPRLDASHQTRREREEPLLARVADAEADGRDREQHRLEVAGHVRQLHGLEQPLGRAEQHVRRDHERDDHGDDEWDWKEPSAFIRLTKGRGITYGSAS